MLPTDYLYLAQVNRHLSSTYLAKPVNPYHSFSTHTGRQDIQAQWATFLKTMMSQISQVFSTTPATDQHFVTSARTLIFNLSTEVQVADVATAIAT